MYQLTSIEPFALVSALKELNRVLLKKHRSPSVNHHRLKMSREDPTMVYILDLVDPFDPIRIFVVIFDVTPHPY